LGVASDSRKASATVRLNGQNVATSRATLHRNANLSTSIGNVDPFRTIHPDYEASVVDVGNKTIRGGQGTVVQASWTEQNPNGNTTIVTVTVFDGVGALGRITLFLDGTTIFLSRVVLDKDGNFVSFEDGSVSTSENVLSAAHSLERASLSPIEVTICDFAAERDVDGNCIGETVRIQAEWTAIGKPAKERFQFTQKTNCDNSLCSTTDQHDDFKVKVTAAGESRNAIAIGSLNGVDLGASTIDAFGQSPFLSSIKEFTIQYGGAYPFEIFPVGRLFF